MRRASDLALGASSKTLWCDASGDIRSQPQQKRRLPPVAPARTAAGARLVTERPAEWLADKRSFLLCLLTPTH